MCIVPTQPKTPQTGELVMVRELTHAELDAFELEAYIGSPNGSDSLDRAYTNARYKRLVDAEERTTWGTVDVGAIARGEQVETPPAMLERSDGVSLIYAGKVHSINSESEAGKTWLSLYVCTEQMLLGSHVLYVDFEDGPAGIVGRLLSLGVTPQMIERQFHYVRPDEPLRGEARTEFDRVLAEWRPALTIIDGVTEAMAMHDLSIASNDDAARFMELVTRPIVRTGSAVVALDHVTKSNEGRGRFAIGAQHKLSGVDGAVFTMTATKTFGRGLSGSSTLYLAKDRPGHVRPHQKNNKAIAQVQFVASAAGGMEVRVVPPGLPAPGSVGEEAGEDETMVAICKVLKEAGGWLATSQITGGVPKRATAVRISLAWLVETGHVKKREQGEGKATMYRLIRPYEPEKEAES